MNKSKCPLCGSGNTIKYGCCNGRQTFRCNECGYRFRNSNLPSDVQIWHLYTESKQTVSQLAIKLGVSESTIKRRLRNICQQWIQPPLHGGGYVHLDATYWGHSWGILLAQDSLTGFPLYLSFIKSETTADYKDAISSIEDRGYQIKGIIIDGKKSLFKEFAGYKIQMCQFHMKEIIKRYLTKNPRLKAARALQKLMKTLTYADGQDFMHDYEEWKSLWHDTLYRRTQHKDGTTPFIHRKLRTAMHSLDFYLPYLFTYQLPECVGMPNTNNKIEGTFTGLKNSLRNHSGMSRENRKRFICGFFLALTEDISMKKQDGR